MSRNYKELHKMKTFKERYLYLKLSGVVGESTFGYDRYLNQTLYKSKEWHAIRNEIIIRDNGCDLGCEGFEIYGKILIHHIDPITPDDILKRHPKVLDPNNLISTSFDTHTAIHYGDENILATEPIERSVNDTIPWK